MPQLLIAAAGAAIGSSVFGATAFTVFGTAISGAQVGWAVGSLIGSAFTPTQKSQGPRLADLSVGTSNYGTTLPYVLGHPRVAGYVAWASAKREIATTTSQGKGGGGSDYTTFTYEIDILYVLAENECTGVRRDWRDGELVFTSASDATAASLDASSASPHWTRRTVYTGGPTQLPDPSYEAVVGSANALAYRGRTSIFYEGLQLGAGHQLPNMTHELATGSSFAGAETILLLKGSAGVTTDSSVFAKTLSVGFGTPTQEATNQLFGADTIKLDSGDRIDMSPDTWFANNFSNREFCIEMWHYATGPTGTGNMFGVGRFSAQLSTAGRLDFVVDNIGGNSYVAQSPNGAVTMNAWHHYALVRDNQDPNPANGRLRLYVDGVQVGVSATFAIADSVAQSAGFGWFLGYGNGALSSPGYYADYRWTVGDRVYHGDFTPPSARLESLVPSTVYTKVGITVSAAVTALCLRSGLTAAQFDVTALASITRLVHSLAISQVTPTRQVLEILMATYFFDATCSDKIYFRPRGSAAVLTLPYSELGWSTGSSPESDPLPLRLANELEIPAMMALTYSNVDADYQPDTQYSDRLLTGQENVSTLQAPLGLTALEAKQLVDATLQDKFVSALTSRISLPLQYAQLEPTDVVPVTGPDGSVYRMRLLTRSDSDGVLTFDTVLDDASVLTQAGLTVGSTTPQTVVVALPDTTLELLDIPILRDVDDRPGFYAAFKGSNTSWHSAALYASLDNVSYSILTTVAEQAAIGTCTSTLGSWSGGNVFDAGNSVTVNVGLGTLSSYTTSDVIARTAPAYLVGSEIIYARTATLISTGVYTLTNLLRGQRGTEWASTGHTGSERFVMLSTSGLRFISLDSSDLGKLRYYKAVSAGQRLSAVTADTITPLGVGLEPFSPFNARVDRSAADHIITWTRRSRLSTRLVGPLASSYPLGEATESYEIDVFISSAAATAGTPVLRTITATSPTATYTSAQRATDGTGSSIVYIRIYQLSALVGRGYPLITSA